MRTQPAHIEPGCPYCEADHDPGIECRLRPESVRFQLQGKAQPVTRRRELITDATGKVIAVREVTE